MFLVRVAGVEPASTAWKAVIIAVIQHPQIYYLEHAAENFEILAKNENKHETKSELTSRPNSISWSQKGGRMLLSELTKKYGFGIRVKIAVPGQQPFKVKEKLSDGKFLCERTPGDDFLLSDYGDFELASDSPTPPLPIG